GERLAIAAEQRAASLLLGEAALGFDIADVVIDRDSIWAVLEVEAADHAVVVEGNVVLEHRRVRVVGHGAEERAVDLGRDLALDRQVAGGKLQPARGVAAGKMDGLRKGVHGVLWSRVLKSDTDCAQR